MITCLFSSNASLSCGDARSILKATMHNITYSVKDGSRSPDCCYKGRCCCSSMGVNCFGMASLAGLYKFQAGLFFLSQPFNINTTFRRHQSIATCKHRRKKAIRMTSSWFSCVSFGYCDIFLQSSSRALQGNGGLCSARFPSWIFLYRQRGPSTLADCSSRTDRSRPPRKRPVFQYLSPFGHGEQHLFADSFLQRVNI